MGKGFNNYMCKKFFHPASRDNLKRVWMAEQKSEAYKRKQEELRLQYEKEQDLHDNKAMLSRDSKDKLSVKFMYEPPPGARKEREKEDDEPDYKFEWQRKYNAPRESYCKGDAEIRDQPFGILVRNVRCIKCHKWGHINTDKECAMYALSMSEARTITDPPNPTQTGEEEEDEDGQLSHTERLVQGLAEVGLKLRPGAVPLGAQQQQSMVSEDVQAPDIIAQLDRKQKKRLLKKLEKLERKNLKKKKSHHSKRDSESPDKKRRKECKKKKEEKYDHCKDKKDKKRRK